MRKKGIEVALLLLVVIVSSCRQSQDTVESLPVFEVAAAQTVDVSGVRSYTFVSQPYRLTDLSFRVGGPMQKIDAQVGMFYRRGDLIASIDDRDFVIRKQEAAAVMEQAKAEYERVSHLYAKNNISGSTYEKAKSAYAIASTSYEDACNELSDTRLTAPFDGYVQQVAVENYQDVRPSQTVVTFIDLSKIKIETYIPEDVALLLRSKKDMKYRIRFDGLKDKVFYSSEGYVSQSSTANNVSFLLTVLLDNDGREFMGGMSGEVELSLGNADEKVVIPQSAVGFSSTYGEYVWVVNGQNQVERRNVVSGNLCSDGWLAVESGIAAGEWVVTTGLSKLTDKQKIAVINK